MKKIKYNTSFCDDIISFFDVKAFCVTQIQKKDGSVTLLETAAELPTFAAFARKIGTTEAELKNWEAKYPAFKYACEQARDRQGNILLQNSLRGNYSASFAVFAAKNLLGWKEGKTGASSGPIAVCWEGETDAQTTH